MGGTYLPFLPRPPRSPFGWSSGGMGVGNLAMRRKIASALLEAVPARALSGVPCATDSLAFPSSILLIKSLMKSTRSLEVMPFVALFNASKSLGWTIRMDSGDFGFLSAIKLSCNWMNGAILRSSVDCLNTLEYQ
jgi:hypothetical protein